MKHSADFLTQPRTASPGDDTAHSELVPLTSITNGKKKNTAQTVTLTSQIDGGIFSIEVPFAQVTLVWVK